MIEQTTFLVAWSIILNFKIIMAGPTNRSGRLALEMYPEIDPAAMKDGGNQAQGLMLSTSSQTTQDPQDAWSIIPINFTGTTSDSTSDDLHNENTNYFENSTTKASNDEVDERPKITIQEIIPQSQEIPVTAPPKLDQNHQGTLLIEQVNCSSDMVTDTDMESSEISETYQHPPQVIKIGDTYRVLKKGEIIHKNGSSSPDSVITIIGAEGLQRGSEERVEIHDVRTTTEGIEDTTVIKDQKTEEDTLNNFTHILSLLKKKKQPKLKNTINSTAVASRETTHSPDETPTMEAKAATKETVAGSISLDAKNDELITDQNPAYPPLPEIFSPNMDDTASQTFDVEAKETAVMNATATASTQLDVSDYTNITEEPDKFLVEELTAKIPIEASERPNTTFVDHHSPGHTTTATRILPEVFDMNANSSVPENTTITGMLKINSDTLINPYAALPDDILGPLDNTTEGETITVQFEDELTSAVESSDDTRFESTETVNETIVTSTRPSRLAESLEVYKIDSGEMVTSRDDHASLLSNENASIELKKDEEADDMVGMKERNNDVDLDDKELKFIDSVDEAQKNGSIPTAMDVEIIDTSTFHKSKPVQKLIEFPVKIIKRESSRDGTDDVITELDKELSDEQTERMVSSDEEQKESDAVFKELLEESSTSKVSQNRDTDILGRVTGALTRLTFSGKADANVLGVLSNIFSSQRNQ